MGCSGRLRLAPMPGGAGRGHPASQRLSGMRQGDCMHQHFWPATCRTASTGATRRRLSALATLQGGFHA